MTRPAPRRPRNDLRKRTLMDLIDLRRRVELMIQNLSGDDEHREFVKRYEQGFATNVRELRHYDVPALEPEVIARMWGVELPD